MSKVNRKSFCLLAIFILFCLFAWGCKSSRTAVESVEFDLTDIGANEISLLVGEEFSPKINFMPSFASNKEYSLTSSDEGVLRTSGHKISAVSAGRAVLTVVANDDNIIQNTILVVVYAERTTLDAPTISYNEQAKKFCFSEVVGATGYVININGHEINLGGSLEYSLEDYAKTYPAFDTTLTAKVRALAPSYNHALQSSDYGEEIAIFQVGALTDVKAEVESGVPYLTFNHPNSTHFNITINGEEFLTNTADKKIALTLPEKFAGQTVALKITALADEVCENCYPAESEIYINVLDAANISLNASVAVWNAVPFAEDYEIFVNGQVVATTKSCSFNLYDYAGAFEQINTLRVQPVLAGQNIATTGREGNEIKFSRAVTPILMVDGESLVWWGENETFGVEVYKGNALTESFATSEPSFDLSKIDSAQYTIKVKTLARALGDVYYLNSQEAEVKVSRLKSPELSYNKQKNEFSIVDENAAGLVKNYSIEYAGDTQFANTLESFKPQFVVGDNDFVLTALANDEVDGVHYLNSHPSKLTINKLKTATAITFGQNDFALQAKQNFFNYLKIETEDKLKHNLILSIEAGGKTITFKTQNLSLIDDEQKYVLPCIFDGGSYYVALLDENFNPLIDELKNDSTSNAGSFGVKVALTSEENLVLPSDEIEEEFLISAKSTLAASGQNIEIENANISAGVENSFLFVNDKLLLNLAEIGTENAGKISFEFTAFLTAVEGQIDTTKPIEIRALNCFENSLSTISQKLDVCLTDAPVLNVEKNVVDLDANNKIKISINNAPSAYEKQYVIKIYNNEGVEQTLFFNDENEVAFYLEEIEKYKDFNDEIFVSAQVAILSQAESGPYMFNSLETQPIKFNKLQAVKNLKIDNGILTFTTAGKNVAFYEIYSLSGDQYTRIGTTKSPSYDLTALTNEEYNLAVVAVAAVSGKTPSVSNSVYSTAILAQKLDMTLDVQNGDFVLYSHKLGQIRSLFDSSTVRAYLRVENLTSGKSFDLSPKQAQHGVTFDFANNKILIEADALLNYGENLTKENLSFQLIVEYGENEADGAYLINSARVETQVFGLIKPGKLNVKYTTQSNNEIIDFIEWKNENNPADLEYKYVLKLTYNEQTYSSLDGSFESNGNPIDLAGGKIKLPTKFTFNSGDAVEFKDGSYHLEIKIYPTSVVEGTIYCSSAYAAANIEILQTPDVAVEFGRASWQTDPHAQGYQIKISANGRPAIYLSTTQTSFNFDTSELSELSGLISIQVQAVSQLKNSGSEILTSVANSGWSAAKTVYKLPNVQAATVDDGLLVLTASKLFVRAEIDFVCGNNKMTYVYDNYDYLNEQLAAIDASDWFEIQGQISSLLEMRKYIIDLSKEDYNGNVVNLLDGMAYTISVRLIGTNIEADGDTALSIVNSNKTTMDINVLKLQKADAKAIARGKLNFAINPNLSLGSLNYNFNEAAPVLNDVEGVKARVYVIDVVIADVTYSIYALDYNYFEKLISSLQADDYNIFENQYGNLYGYLKLNSNGNEIYLNVYKDGDGTANVLDFGAQKIYYYAITAQLDAENGEINYSMQKSISIIDTSVGGNFEVNVYLLGGDSVGTNANFTSRAMERYFVRYAINALSTNGGELQFKDLTPLDEEGAVLDYPVYKIVATSTAGTKTIYLYYGKNNLDKVSSMFGGDAEFVEITKFVEVQNTKSVLFEVSKVLDGATYYDITIQTLAGLGVNENANYLLNAVEASEKLRVYKLGIAQMAIDTTNGVCLEFNLADRPAHAYEISLTNQAKTKTYVYVVNEASAGVKISNGKMYYSLPKTIVTNTGERVDTTDTYTITIRAMSGEENVINGAYGGASYNITRAQEVTDFKIENGMLNIDAPESVKQLYVRLGYKVGGETKYLYFKLPNDKKPYTFSDSASYSVEGANYFEAITADNNYTLSVYSLGYQDGSTYVLNNAMLDGGIALKRLPTISGLQAIKGVLSWNEVEGAAKYLVTVLGVDKTFETETNSIVLSDLAAGEYQISVRAIGSNKINAMNSSSQKFVKLAAVEGDFELSGNTITWQPVEGAQNYYAEFEYTIGDEAVVEPKTTSTASVEAPNSLNGQFTLRVQACVDNKPDTLNSNFTTYKSSIEVPHAVESIEWEPDAYRIKIVTAQDFAESDHIQLVYYVKKYIYSNGHANLDNNQQTEIVQIAHSAQSNVYYFYPSIMGEYSMFAATIVRENSLSSGTMVYNQMVNLHLFSEGDGDATPYRISTIDEISATEQLFNIKYRPNAKYVLGQTVDLSNQEIDNYDGVISQEFGGELDGGGFAISGLNFTIKDSNFALFKTLNKAKIYNLILGTANTIEATYTKANEIYLAVLAEKANDSTLQQITLKQTSITISGRAENNVFVGGLVALAQNTSFLGCVAAVELDYGVKSTLTKYVGGLAASAVGGQFASYNYINTAVNLTLKNSLKETDAVISYLGGLVGEYRSNAQNKGKISSAKVTLQINSTNALNVGGIAGYLGFVEMDNSEAGGTISTATLAPQSKINLGGLVGRMQSSTIKTSGVNIAFDIQKNSTLTQNSDIRIGVLVGEISTISDNKNVVSGCYSYTEFTSGVTNLNSQPFVLGVCGFLNTAALDGNLECEKRT